jgi:hypothetical protein
MSEKTESNERSKDSDSLHEPRKGIDWSDPSVPVGNGPPMPRWPLVLGSIALLVWLVFLLVMALTRQIGAAA